MRSFYDEKLDLLLKHASADVLCDIADAYPDDVPVVQFSSQFERSIKKTLRNEAVRTRRIRHAKRYASIFKALRFAGAAASMLVAAFYLIAFTTEPVRVATANFFIDAGNGTYVSTHYTDEMQEDITRNVLGYIPEGYRIEDFEEGPNTLTVLFVNQTGRDIRFSRMDSSSQVTISTEGKLIQPLDFSVALGNCFYSESSTTIAISDACYTYIISSGESKDELLKMAENVFYCAE